MHEYNVRTLVWYVSLILFFPCWIAAMRGYVYLTRAFDIVLPRWLDALMHVFILGGVMMLIAYTAARLLDRRYPNSPPRSASWDEQR